MTNNLRRLPYSFSVRLLVIGVFPRRIVSMALSDGHG
jgi:hypothetical protein